MSSDKAQILTFQFIKFLEAKRDENPSEFSSIDETISKLSSIFGIDTADPSQFTTLSYMHSLQEIFDAGTFYLKSQSYEEAVTTAQSNPKYASFFATVLKKNYFDGVEEGTVQYLKRHSKVLLKFQEKLNEKKNPPSAQKKLEQENEAEDKKSAGNEAISQKDYNAAVRLYTEALELSPDGPNSHIYYSNRAAAHCYLSSYELAVADCEACVAICPTYVKGYTRLGLANYSMGNYEASIEAYKKCIELEPKVKAHKDALTQMKQKMAEKMGSSGAASSAGGDGNYPDMSALAGMMGGAGGKGGLSAMMQNPAMMKVSIILYLLYFFEEF